MKAAILKGEDKFLQVGETDKPVAGPNQLLVKLHCCGLCHSDLHIVDRDWPVTEFLPLIPGHEGIGEVCGLGQDSSGWEVGDLVGIPLMNRACGDCRQCRSGRETLCEKILLTGFHIDGCFAEYALVDADFAVAVPGDRAPEELAPILCAGVTVYRGIKIMQLEAGQFLSIWGIGGLGHVAIQYAKTLGLQVVAVDIDAGKLELAKECGADFCVNSMATDPVPELKRICRGADAALVTATSIEAFEQAYRSIRPAGVFVSLGIPSGKLVLDIPEYMSRQVTIKGSSIGTRQDMKECLSVLAAHPIKPRISLYELNQVNEALDELRCNRIDGRVVVLCS